MRNAVAKARSLDEATDLNLIGFDTDFCSKIADSCFLASSLHLESEHLSLRKLCLLRYGSFLTQTDN